MFPQIDPHCGVPIYRQLIDQVRHQILSGRMAEGEQLVPVRDLAARLRVNPMTVSKAYSLLENEGLLERRRGIGLFVARVRRDRRKRDAIQLLEENLRQAAVSAVQLGVSEAEAHKILAQLYQRYQNGKEPPS